MLTSDFDGASGAQRPKPALFKVGVGLFILYPLLLATAALTAFAPLSGGTRAIIVTGILLTSKGTFMLATVCVGKEAYQALTAKFRGRKRPWAQRRCSRAPRLPLQKTEQMQI